MRITAVILTVLLASAAFAGEGTPTPAPKPPVLESVWFEVPGLAPEKAPAVLAAVKTVPGVQNATWSVPNAEVRVVREAGKAADADLVKVCATAGGTAARVPVVGRVFTFETTLHCGGCGKKVVTALSKLPGMKDAVVAADLATVTVAYDTRAVDEAKIREAITKAGHPVRP